MDYEFDKEIDALLRQTAPGETAFELANPTSQIPNPKSKHLDADEISALAENALPEATRQKYARHLADCDGCRKSLSSLIVLNSATENAAAVHAEEKHSVTTAPIPWYRKLFAFQNLAYTLGALVLVFSGVVAYTLLQNVNNSQSAEVSQISERQPNGKGMNSDGDTSMTESYSSNMTSNANMMMSNSASMNSSSSTAANFSNPAMPAAPTAVMNSNAAVRMREDSDKNLRAEAKSLAPPKESADSAATQDSIAAGAPPPPPPAKENDYRFDGETQRQQPNQAQNSIAQNQSNITPDSRNVQQRAPMPTALSENEKNKKVQISKNDKQEKSNEPISVGGKTFKRTNNVWYDSAYRGQATTNVTRGTNEYKKLDSGLRGIAENLGGTIVVVWKGKAYRIQ